MTDTGIHHSSCTCNCTTKIRGTSKCGRCAKPIAMEK